MILYDYTIPYDIYLSSARTIFHVIKIFQLLMSNQKNPFKMFAETIKSFVQKSAVLIPKISALKTKNERHVSSGQLPASARRQ